MFPMDGTFLPSQGIPILLVIIDDGLIETPLQFFQCHPPSLCRQRCVVYSMTGVGHASFKGLRHPPKKSFAAPFPSSSIWPTLSCPTPTPTTPPPPSTFRA